MTNLTTKLQKQARAQSVSSNDCYNIEVVTLPVLDYIIATTAEAAAREALERVGKKVAAEQRMKAFKSQDYDDGQFETCAAILTHITKLKEEMFSSNE